MVSCIEWVISNCVICRLWLSPSSSPRTFWFMHKTSLFYCHHSTPLPSVLWKDITKAHNHNTSSLFTLKWQAVHQLLFKNCKKTIDQLANIFKTKNDWWNCLSLVDSYHLRYDAYLQALCTVQPLVDCYLTDLLILLGGKAITLFRAVKFTSPRFPSVSKLRSEFSRTDSSSDWNSGSLKK